MVFEAVAGVLEAVQNALLISFGRVFDFIFSFEWAGGSEIVWTLLGALVILWLFL